jgi:hypothetical protein
MTQLFARRRVAPALLASLVGVGASLGTAGVAGASVRSTAPLAGSLTADGLQAVSCAGSVCMAVGATASGANAKPLSERWSGTSWVVETTPAPTGAVSAHLLGVSCPSADACVAVGSYEVKSGLIYPLAESWNGSKWAAQSVPYPKGSPQNSLAAVVCISSSSCVAVGTQATARVVFYSLGEEWNGSKWTVEATPSPANAADTSLSSVSCPAADFCLAVGNYGNNQGATLASSEVWNGKKWAAESTPNPSGTSDTSLSGVSCLSAKVCVAVGGYLPSKKGSVELSTAELWNGSKWTVGSAGTPSGAAGTDLDSVSCASVKSCVSVGDYANSKSLLLPVAEQWDGAHWTVTATPRTPASSCLFRRPGTARSGRCGRRLTESRGTGRLKVTRTLVSRPDAGSGESPVLAARPFGPAQVSKLSNISVEQL